MARSSPDRSFANTELVPKAAKWDQEHSFPKAAVQQLGEMGLMGVAIPEEVRARGFEPNHLAWLDG